MPSVGAAVWTAVLCAVGVVAGQDAALLAGDMHRVTLWLAGAVGVLGILYWLLVYRFMRGG